ncbi:MAG: signal peptidase I [Eubacteriales bacterium]|nr:signal peptidase I [Eubacteriales bacterium]
MEKNNKNTSRRKKTGKIAGRIILGIIAVCTLWLLVCFFTGNIPMFFGYGFIRIQSGSMEPAIQTGDFILIEKADADEIKVGDIITFKSDDPTIKDLPNTHRVDEIIAGDNGNIEFITKGDANLTPDIQTAKGDRIYGRYVTTLTALTAVYSVLSKPYVFWPLMILIVGLIIFISVLDVRKENTNKKQKDMDRLVAEEIEKLKSSENIISDSEENDKSNDINDTKGGNGSDV